MGQKFRPIQSIFNKGELSPRLIGRVENEAYYKAFDYGNNMLPYPEGAITLRPGTVYVNKVKDSTKLTIIRPFRFSTVQNYIIEFGDQYVRFYRNRGVVETAPNTPYEVSTPYLEADLRELYMWQSADVLYIAHPDYQTRKLTRTSDTSWTLTTATFNDGPYLPINSSSTTFARSGTTVTASASTFVAGDVGRQIRMKSGSAWSWMTITAYTSGTQVTVDNSGTIAATTDWRLGVFGGDLGWPAIGSIYEERLILARTVNLPSTVWGSETGDFESFAPSAPSDGTVGDDNGFSFTIADDQVNAINWLSSGRILLIGTSGGEHSMTGGTASGYAPLTPTNVTIKRESNFGSAANIRVHRVGNAVLYPSQSAKKIREIYYEFNVDSYVSKDTTLFNEHILRAGVVDADYTQEPDPYLWTCDEAGQLIGMVYERTNDIYGWHRHTIAGTDAIVESLAVIPRPGEEDDDLWLVVRRTIDGDTVRYIEYISELFEDSKATLVNAPDRPYAKYLDSCLTYDGYLDATLTPFATTGSSITFTAGSSVFDSGDVGKQIRYGSSKAIITTYNSGTSVDADITVDFPNTSAIASGLWSLQAKTFSGLDHLEGETVGVQTDGATTDDEIVSSGSITINNFASVVHVGLKYSSTLTFLPVEIPQVGTIQGREKSVSELHMFVTNTYGLKVNGSDVPDVTDTVKFLQFPIVTDEAQPLKTGIISVHPPSGYQKDGQITLEHTLAQPFTLNYIVQVIDVND